LRCVALPPSWPLRRHPAWAYAIRPYILTIALYIVAHDVATHPR
jgi:hypothetical protein